MRRREFITLAGGVATWPLAVLAQKNNPIRRVAILVPQAETDPEQRSWIAAFATRLRQLGWNPGENVQIDYRWASGDMARMVSLAKELINLQPDVILAATATASTAFRQYTLTIPIIFTQVPDPVAAGLVTNLARPEGNITGFTVYEFSISGKWIEALKECVPTLKEVAVFFDPESLPWSGYMRSVEASARPLQLHLNPFPIRSAADIEHAFGTFATERNRGAIVLPTGGTLRHRNALIALAAQYRLPTMYPYRLFALDGGLMSYGTDLADQHRQAASYVDRILRGEKPSDLPVQLPTKFQFVINLKTARALGLSLAPALIARADEVIE